MLTLQIVDTTKTIEPLEAKVRASAQRTFEICCKLIPIPDLTLIVQRNPIFAMRETGLVGYSPGPELNIVSIDPCHPSIEDSVGEELCAVIAHEMHHCARWKGPGYGGTLLEALISEGLARDFERRLRGGKLPPYHLTLTEKESERLFDLVAQELSSSNYDHKTWFFGGSENISLIPRHAGYSLGLILVEKYCKKTGLNSAELWNKPASFFWD